MNDKLKKNRAKQKSNGLKRDRPQEPDAGPDLDDETKNPFYELGLLNQHLISKRQEDMVEIETAYFNELMSYIKILEDENTQLKLEIDLLDTASFLNIFSSSPSSDRIKTPE